MAATAAALSGILLNPPSTAAFGTRHVILNGRTSKEMRIASFAGPFSIKSVVTGCATWETANGRYVLAPGRHLILNRGTTYSLTIDGGRQVETFCVFFQDGFVEQALRSITEPDARLLDAPAERAESFALLEAIDDSTQSVGQQIAALHRRVQEGAASTAMSGAIQEAAVAVVGRSAALTRMSRRLPAVRPATRRELVRRLHQARDFMHGAFTAPIALADIAREACLSPFHFHRSYRTLFGETPHRFVVRLRLDRAALLLRGTATSVTEIAIAVGFDSPAHFSRAFRQRFRCTPQNYREQFGCS